MRTEQNQEVRAEQKGQQKQELRTEQKGQPFLLYLPTFLGSTAIVDSQKGQQKQEVKTAKQLKEEKL